MPSSKICSRCKTEKPLEEFHRHRKHKDGHRSCCKECRSKGVVTSDAHRLRSLENGNNKSCPKCLTIKPLTDFYKSKDRRRGLSTYCIQCDKDIQKSRYSAENVDKNRSLRLERIYGLDSHSYQQIIDSQGGRCAICDNDEPGGRWNTFHLDHCHESDQVRGLLCHRCNTGLGQFQDDPERLEAAAKYLREHNG